MLAVAAKAKPPEYRPRLIEVAEPRPGRGEVVLEVRATALNRADLLQLRGLYPPPPGEPEAPGLECAGRVAEIGPEVRGWQVGERAMALLGGGGHAERVAVPVGQLLPVPEQLSWREAAAVPEAAMTAWVNLVSEGGLEPGETVLISGAGGGIGSFAVQLACQLGATVVAVGRSLDRLEALRPLGAHHLLIDDDELPRRLREALGKGADLVFDTVSGERLPSHLAVLEERGRLVLVGLMAGLKAEVDLATVLRRRLRLIGSVLRARPREEKARLVEAFAAFGGERLADGRLRPLLDRCLPFARIDEAYAVMEAGGLLGKVVVEMP